MQEDQASFSSERLSHMWSCGAQRGLEARITDLVEGSCMFNIHTPEDFASHWVVFSKAV